jgi:hypothetical protein
MVMNPASAMGERLAGAIWREGIRLAVIDASPMRPGRGRRSSPARGRRLESPGGLMRFESLVASLVEGLRTGPLDPAPARREVAEAALESFIRVVEAREDAAAAFTDFFEQGYFLQGSEEWNGVLHVRFCTRKQLT